jgi:riboflavin biosynthesis pyrimidine reductase
MVGRVTMEKDFTKGEQPELIAPENPIAREPFIGDKDASSFAIAVDANGKLGWKSNEIGGDHIIEVLTEQVSDAYLYYLQQREISYIFAGKDELDFKSALNQLVELFPIQTIMLEGGGHINGSLLNDGLIDELSLLIIPIADGTPNTPTTFEVSEYLQKKPATLLYLTEVKQLGSGVVWLKYRIDSQ